MKRMLCIWLSLVLILAAAMPTAAAADGVELRLSEANSAAGYEVELVLSVENHQGLKGLSADLVYDEDVLTLLSATPKTDLGTWDVETIDQDGVLFWYSADSFTGEQLVSLRFRVADDAPLGRTEVSLQMGDWRGLYDGEGEKISDVTLTAGGVTVVEAPEVFFYGTSLSAMGNIGLNAYLYFSDSFLQDSGAYITVDENQYPVSQAPTTTQSGLTLYRFSVERAAADMNKPAAIRAYRGDGTEVAIDSYGTVLPQGFTTTVRDYLETAPQYLTGARVLAVIAAMSDYGHYAQVHFQRDLDKLAPLQGDVSQVTQADLAPYAASYSQAEDSGVEFYGSSLTVKSNTIMSHYFSIRSGSVEDYRFLLDGQQVSLRQNGAYWAVDLTGIPASQLDTGHTIRVLDGDREILNISYCALSYCKETLEYSQDENLLNLVKAIYLYNQAANEYFQK